jgi:multiple sugar transport system ATP-binding protein
VLGADRLPLDEGTVVNHAGLASYVGREVIIGIRPEDLEDGTVANGDGRPRLAGRVALREALGSEVLVHFTIDGRQAVTEEMRELAEDVGDDRVVQQLATGGSTTAKLVGRFSPRTRVADGAAVEVAVDERALHFFDPETGLAITA